MRKACLSVWFTVHLIGIAGAQSLPEPVEFGLRPLHEFCQGYDSYLQEDSYLIYPDDLLAAYLEADVNGDGEPDYVIHWCEFRCSFGQVFHTNGIGCLASTLVVSDPPSYILVDPRDDPFRVFEREGEPDILIGLRRRFIFDTGLMANCHSYACWIDLEFDGSNLVLTHMADDEASLLRQLSED